MADTVRTLAALQTLLADNTAGDISAQDVRDMLVSTYPNWTSWSPTWTGSSNPAIGNGTLTAFYREDLYTVQFSITVVMGSTTTYGGTDWAFSTPTSSVAEQTCGFAYLKETGVLVSSGTSVTFSDKIYVQVNSSGFPYIGNAVPFTWGTNDVLSIKGWYVKP